MGTDRSLSASKPALEMGTSQTVQVSFFFFFFLPSFKVRMILKQLEDSMSQLLICFQMYYLGRPIYFLKLFFLLVSFYL